MKAHLRITCPLIQRLGRRRLERSMLGLTQQLRQLTSRHLPGTSHRQALLLVGEHAHADDDTRFLLALIRVLRRESDLQLRVLLKHDGSLLPHFLEQADTTLVDSHSEESLAHWFRHSGCDRAIFNGCATGDLMDAAKSAGLHCVALINETDAVVREESVQMPAHEIAHLARHVVFPADRVRCEFLQREPFIRAAVHRLTPPDRLLFEASDTHADPRQIRQRLKLGTGDRLIIGSGRGNRRRGFDRFLQSAERLCRSDAHLHFCWLGRRSRDMRRWLRTHPPAIPEARLHLLDDVTDLTPWLRAADCLYLASRYDSFPHSALQAATIGTPVVHHADATAFDLPYPAALQAPADDDARADAQLLKALASDGDAACADGTDCDNPRSGLSPADYVARLLALATPETTPTSTPTLTDTLWPDGRTADLVGG